MTCRIELLNNYDQLVYIPDANFGIQLSTRRYYAGFTVTSNAGYTDHLGVGGEKQPAPNTAISS